MNEALLNLITLNTMKAENQKKKGLTTKSNFASGDETKLTTPFIPRRVRFNM